MLLGKLCQDFLSPLITTAIHNIDKYKIPVAHVSIKILYLHGRLLWSNTSDYNTGQWQWGGNFELISPLA